MVPGEWREVSPWPGPVGSMSAPVQPLQTLPLGNTPTSGREGGRNTGGMQTIGAV